MHSVKICLLLHIYDNLITFVLNYIIILAITYATINLRMTAFNVHQCVLVRSTEFTNKNVVDGHCFH